MREGAQHRAGGDPRSSFRTCAAPPHGLWECLARRIGNGNFLTCALMGDPFDLSFDLQYCAVSEAEPGFRFGHPGKTLELGLHVKLELYLIVVVDLIHYGV